MFKTCWNPLDSYCKRAPEVLVRLERPGRAKVGASQRFSASLAAPAKLPSMQSLRWCSITKDSKSGCAIFSAFSLTSKECHDAKKQRTPRTECTPPAATLDSLDPNTPKARQKDTAPRVPSQRNVLVTMFQTWAVGLWKALSACLSLKHETWAAADIVKRLTKSKNTAESMPEPEEFEGVQLQ